MKRKLIVVILAFGFVVLSGCAANMSVSIKAKPNIAKSDIGQGTELAVQVTDSRSSKILGHWHGNAFYDEADVETRDELVDLFKREILNGLNGKGFTISPYRDDHPVRLDLDIVRYDYNQTFGVWLQGISCNGTLRVTAFKKGRKFEKLYDSVSSDNIAMVEPEYVGNMIGKTVDELIEKIVGDPDLMSFLTK